MRGYTINRDDYLSRLRRIEGQVRGLQRMIQADEYCIDVITQLSSVTAARQSVALGLVDEHLRHCVMQATLSGDDHRARRQAHRSSPSRVTARTHPTLAGRRPSNRHRRPNRPQRRAGVTQCTTETGTTAGAMAPGG